jgi:iron-sulfur cluster insertion protein
MLSITGNAYAALRKKLGIDEDLQPSQMPFSIIESTYPKKRFRVKILGGGCSGFQYKFTIDDNIADRDKIFGSNNTNLEIVIDEHSLPLITNSTINYNKSISGEYFFIENPNATSKCGCGNSFSV